MEAEHRGKENFYSAPPRLRSTHLPRPRIQTILSEIPDFTVTLVKAGAGYGKTTAVVSYLQQSRIQGSWLTLYEEDLDGVRLVQHLLNAEIFGQVPEAERQRVVIAAHSPLTWVASAHMAADLINLYIHEECLIVFDDFHLLDGIPAIAAWMDLWLRELPPNLHVVLVTRTRPEMPWLEELSLRGELLLVQERELAFNEAEIGFMFTDAGENVRFVQSQVRWLLARTGGMAMVLSILHRDWRQHLDFQRLQVALDSGHSLQEQVGRLFMQDLNENQRNFLGHTCLFSGLNPALCNRALTRQDSEEMLTEMERKGYLTLTEDRQEYLLHPLVRDYLSQQLSSTQRSEQLQQAVSWHLSRDEEARAVGYLFLLDNPQRLTQALFSYIPAYLARGQVSTVQGWLDRLSPGILAGSSGLLFAKAEVARQTNRFVEALHFYAQAHDVATATMDRAVLTQVEMGRARLYLDTIQPKRAMEYIRAARQFVERKDKVTRYQILQLVFENWINLGRMKNAKGLWRVLQDLNWEQLPQNNSDMRLLLRTGQVHAVIAGLQVRVSQDTEQGRRSLAHREASLLLALMYSLVGEADKAKAQALRGHRVGDVLQAPFVSAVGFIRLGHAEHLRDPMGQAALTAYQEAVQRMDAMAIPRGKSEALLGLCLAHGYRQQFVLAQSHAEHGIAVAEAAGDIWMASFVRIAYGQTCVINRVYDLAEEVLTRCELDFERCGDPYLQAASRLWRAISRFQRGDPRFRADIAKVLDAVSCHDYEFLLDRPTFCGVRDLQVLVPLLQAYHRGSIEETVGQGTKPGPPEETPGNTRLDQLSLQILHQLQGDSLDHPPGYTLRVQTFAGLSVWRGFAGISRREWQRDKARQLFEFLITRRGQFLHREEICEQLWEDASPSTAERDFKVALTVLSNVLEPNKSTRGPSVFIERRGSLYGLNRHPMLWVDRDVFLQVLREANASVDREQRRSLLEFALSLYQGDYLPEVRYEPWCMGEQERLRLLFVQAAVEFSSISCEQGHYGEALEATERALRAEPTWEDGYIWQMRAYAGMYNRAMVMQTYHTCQRVMKQELGVAIGPTTRRVFAELMGEFGYPREP